jgi:hypothetical protein
MRRLGERRRHLAYAAVDLTRVRPAVAERPSEDQRGDGDGWCDSEPEANRDGSLPDTESDGTEQEENCYRQCRTQLCMVVIQPVGDLAHRVRQD